jgi:hypothetical protein
MQTVKTMSGEAIENLEDWADDDDVDMPSLKDISTANEIYRTPAKLKIGDFITKTTDPVKTDSFMDGKSYVKVEVLEVDLDERDEQMTDETFNK